MHYSNYSQLPQLSPFCILKSEREIQEIQQVFTKCSVFLSFPSDLFRSCRLSFSSISLGLCGITIQPGRRIKILTRCIDTLFHLILFKLKYAALKINMAKSVFYLLSSNNSWRKTNDGIPMLLWVVCAWGDSWRRMPSCRDCPVHDALASDGSRNIGA